MAHGAPSDLVAVEYPDVRLAGLTLAAATRAGLDRVLDEQRQRGPLESHGFAPVRRLLLTGPAGTGKSMSAAALATELSLPLVTIRLDALTSNYTGERATKTRVVFDALAGSLAVCLFDGLDAIEARQATWHDIGEARRILDMCLCFLEDVQPRSLAATVIENPSLLDRALARRFCAVVAFAPPDAAQALDLLRRHLGTVNTAGVAWDEVGDHVSGLSHAGLVRAAGTAAKRAVVGGAASVSTAMLVTALVEFREVRRLIGFSGSSR